MPKRCDEHAHRRPRGEPAPGGRQDGLGREEARARRAATGTDRGSRRGGDGRAPTCPGRPGGRLLRLARARLAGDAAPGRGEAGTTLVELLVVLAIVSILAVAAIPLAETAVQRRHELALRETLRTTRSAIDAFHDDWAAERIAVDDEAASEAGYPVSLDVLVEGVELDTDPPALRRYLRRLPENPFEGGWRLRGHAQDPGGAWDGEDVYDLSADTDRLALDGTRLSDW